VSIASLKSIASPREREAKKRLMNNMTLDEKIRFFRDSNVQ
jgi:hypothetical protein